MAVGPLGRVRPVPPPPLPAAPLPPPLRCPPLPSAPHFKRRGRLRGAPAEPGTRGRAARGAPPGRGTGAAPPPPNTHPTPPPLPRAGQGVGSAVLIRSSWGVAGGALAGRGKGGVGVSRTPPPPLSAGAAAGGQGGRSPGESSPGQRRGAGGEKE